MESKAAESTGLQLQRAVFLRGVSDPTETSRITTVFYRPKHEDLRYEGGFIRAGVVSIPLSNVVEMITLLGNTIERHPEVPADVDALATEIEEQPADAEDKPYRRRGRPRKAQS